MSYKEQINAAFDFAIENHYAVYKEQAKILRRIREAECICLFGTGKFLSDYVKNVHRFDFVCDNDSNKWGKEFYGRRCISPKELAEKKNTVVIVMAGNYKAIMEQLNTIHVENYFFGSLYLNIYDQHYDQAWFLKNKGKAIQTVDLFHDEQSKEVYTECLCNRIAPNIAKKTFHEIETAGEYFETGIWDVTEGEAFVDAGAFDGDSIEKFIEAANGRYDAIYGFELDALNYKQLTEKTKQYKNIHLYHEGVFNENKTLMINGSGTGTHIKQGSDLIANVSRMDDRLKDKRITLIKMDIEGSEMQALEGAKNIIELQKPKLAISAYHHLSDLWEVPHYIKELNKDYHIYMRHHTAVVWDTDCYAY